jgi:hypothetical protein
MYITINDFLNFVATVTVAIENFENQEPHRDIEALLFRFKVSRTGEMSGFDSNHIYPVISYYFAGVLSKNDESNHLEIQGYTCDRKPD